MPWICQEVWLFKWKILRSTFLLHLTDLSGSFKEQLRAHLTCRRNEPAVVCVMIDLRVVFTDKFVQWLVLWSIAAENWYRYLEGMKYRLNLIYTAYFRYISNHWLKFLLDCAKHTIVRCDINLWPIHKWSLIHVGIPKWSQALFSFTAVISHTYLGANPLVVW